MCQSYFSKRSFKLDLRHSVFFGDVVVGSQATKPVRLHNFGDLGAKFRFEIGAKYSKIFSITPCEGFLRCSDSPQRPETGARKALNPRIILYIV